MVWRFGCSLVIRALRQSADRVPREIKCIFYNHKMTNSNVSHCNNLFLNQLVWPMPFSAALPIKKPAKNRN